MLVRKPDGTVVRVRRPAAALVNNGIAPATNTTLTKPSTDKTMPSIIVPLLASKTTAEPSRPLQSSSPERLQGASTLPELEHTVDDVRKRKRRVNRIYNMLHKTASVYPSDLTNADDLLDHDDMSIGSNSGHDSQDSDNDSQHRGKHHASDAKDNKSLKSRLSHDGEGGSHTATTLGASNARSAAKTLAGATKTNVKAAEMSVFRPRADSDVEKRQLPKSTAGPEIETINDKTAQGGASTSFKGASLGGNPALQVTEKEVCNTDSAEEAKKPRKRAPRELGRRTSKLAQGVAWGIALSCPILFISMSIPALSCIR